jgi:hypothetical protein
MRRFTTAVVLMALVAARGNTQPVPIAPPGPEARQVPVPIVPPRPGAKMVPVPASVPAPIVIPVTSAKPPSGYYKSGGVLVGADGYYPFDTGRYLLGGFDGLTRYSGTYYMVAPGAATVPLQAAPPIEPIPIYAAPAGPTRGRLFHRR